MGSMHAMELAGSSIPQRVALEYHFTGNHYPPLPLSLIPIAETAIELANHGEWDNKLALPDGISYKGTTSAPVWACVEEWHLEWFLSNDEEEE